MADYYSLLKIRRDATQDEVKRAYLGTTHAGVEPAS